jgi:hypothetical protein
MKYDSLQIAAPTPPDCMSNKMPRLDVTQLKTGDRVRAIQKIYHQSFRNVAVEAGTQGTVQTFWWEKGHVAVLWDTGIRFFCSVEKLTQTGERFRLKGTRTLTQPQMLAFQSIFDLLTRLGFEEDTEGQRMVDRGAWVDIHHRTAADRYIDFDQIAGRTVTEFVREGMQKGFLHDYLKEASLL